MKRINLIALTLILVTSFYLSIHSDYSVHYAKAVESESVNTLIEQDDPSMDSKTEGQELDNMMEENIDSFELFWPITAGKTRGESLYFLKRLKEKFRGVLIFGEANDADYQLFLATKRVVETEKLINENNLDEARNTLDEALENIDKASEKWSEVDDRDTPVKHEMNNKLNNLETFLPYLSTLTQDSATVESVNTLNEKVIALNGQV